MTNVSRREYLAAVTATAGGLAGCSTTGDSSTSTTTTIQDSDGDGVIDSKDYAPHDPSVQRKSDLEGATKAASTITHTPTGTTTISLFTETASETRTTTVESGKSLQDSSNTITTQHHLQSHSYIASYSATHATTVVQATPTIPQSRVKLLVGAYKFPRGDSVAYGVSNQFVPPSSGVSQLTTTLTSGSIPRDTRLHHLAYAMPADATVDTVSTDDLTFLYETDPFVVSSQTNRIARSGPPYLPDNASTDSFTRTGVEGAFRLDFSGMTKDRSWDVNLFVWKSAYAKEREQPRGRGYDEYVGLAQRNGNAEMMAGILNDAAEANGFTGKREKVEMAIDWVQSLPYVTDEVSRGYDDYAKFLTETLVDASGDCEDTAILMASVLQADPFGYDMVLIEPPGHMACGIYGTDLPGYYWTKNGQQYYYIETTGEGWGIGDLPEEYQGASATVYQV